MRQVTKERIAIVTITAVLFVGGEWSLPRLLAALIGGVFFCWFVGWRRPAREPQAGPRA